MRQTHSDGDKVGKTKCLFTNFDYILARGILKIIYIQRKNVKIKKETFN
jgi:hypothetical protein